MPNKFDNVSKSQITWKTYNLPNLIQEKINNLSIFLSIKEIEILVINLPIKKTLKIWKQEVQLASGRSEIRNSCISSPYQGPMVSHIFFFPFSCCFSFLFQKHEPNMPSLAWPPIIFIKSHIQILRKNGIDSSWGLFGFGFIAHIPSEQRLA